tara:strand:+ start:5062 stop:5928 length:867 start_codon:yes stop_codon:yes gene_type:complete
MAIFGDLGKALGLGSAKDVLPIIGTAAGFYFGGPLGASLGSGIGSLAGGKSVNDALTNAALAYGVTSFVPSSMMSSGAQANTGMFGPNALQRSLYSGGAGIPTTMAGPENFLSEGMTTGSTSGGGSSMFGGVMDFVKDNKMLTAGLGTLALGALSSPEEEETRNPDYGRPGEAWDVEYRGVRYDLDDPEEREAYKARKDADRKEYSEREPVLAAHGGAMYGHDKMSYDTPITGEVSGPGTGTSDSVPARLSDGEFVLTAKSVRGAGGGDRDIGAARLYDMMAELEATA